MFDNPKVVFLKEMFGKILIVKLFDWCFSKLA